MNSVVDYADLLRRAHKEATYAYQFGGATSYGFGAMEACEIARFALEELIERQDAARECAAEGFCQQSE